MQIVKFQLRNYKSYNQPVPMEFGSGINVITGQNNAGKTALVEALSFGLRATPHKSVETLPTKTSPLNDTTRIDVTLRISAAELRELFIKYRGNTLFVPLPALNTAFTNEIDYRGHHWGFVEKLLEWLLSQPFHDVPLVLERRTNSQQVWSSQRVPAIGGYPPEGSAGNYQGRQVQVTADLELRFADVNTVTIGATQDLGSLFAPSMIERIYFFKAERPNIGYSKFGGSQLLASDASNLPEVLSELQHDHPRFDRFNSLVHRVFPQIGRIGTRRATDTNRHGADMLEIVIGPNDRSLERADLSIPLADSGTGIGQVLAILYVVVNSDGPQTMIIDEPSSFLHPGAVRKLVEILKANPQNQYILTTHSPAIISAAQPDTILLITHEGSESKLECLDATQSEHLRRYLDEIGASLADVFGADGIIWVEGITEEKCYPRIVEKLLKQPLMGKIIKAVIATGDFEGKHAERFFEIYNKLSGAESLLPPAVSFLLDDEGRNPEQKKILQSLGKGRVHFTKRRMYENYLLDSRAITAVVNSTEGHTKQVRQEDIQGYLDGCLDDPKRFLPLEKARGINWIRADIVLKNLFWEIAELNYRKSKHSVELTQWFIDNHPDQLRDISDLLRDVLA